MRIFVKALKTRDLVLVLLSSLLSSGAGAEGFTDSLMWKLPEKSKFHRTWLLGDFQDYCKVPRTEFNPSKNCGEGASDPECTLTLNARFHEAIHDELKKETPPSVCEGANNTEAWTIGISEGAFGEGSSVMAGLPDATPLHCAKYRKEPPPKKDNIALSCCDKGYKHAVNLLLTKIKTKIAREQIDPPRQVAGCLCEQEYQAGFEHGKMMCDQKICMGDPPKGQRPFFPACVTAGIVQGLAPCSEITHQMLQTNYPALADGQKTAGKASTTRTLNSQPTATRGQ